jgi:hypothetical protein
LAWIRLTICKLHILLLFQVIPNNLSKKKTYIYYQPFVVNTTANGQVIAIIEKLNYNPWVSIPLFSGVKLPAFPNDQITFCCSSKNPPRAAFLCGRPHASSFMNKLMEDELKNRWEQPNEIRQVRFISLIWESRGKITRPRTQPAAAELMDINTCSL